jgi:hypothetical protein
VQKGAGLAQIPNPYLCGPPADTPLLGQPCRIPIESLTWNWGEAYVISYADGLWLAQRRDNRETLRADDPEALRDAIIKDYAARPVRRDGDAR